MALAVSRTADGTQLVEVLLVADPRHVLLLVNLTS